MCTRNFWPYKFSLAPDLPSPHTFKFWWPRWVMLEKKALSATWADFCLLRTQVKKQKLLPAFPSSISVKKE